MKALIRMTADRPHNSLSFGILTNGVSPPRDHWR